MDKQLLKGNTDMLILASLSNAPKHGYLITKYLRDMSDSEFQFSAGMLYPILHKLENDQCIEGKWKKEKNGRERKYYSLTDKGRTLLEGKKEEWSTFISFITNVIHA